ncbi:MAG: hypothetical protein ABT10_05805 [Novosphingobium sp. SCN 63-17]|nr:MAG: hypothetical protein ABT10_05805 [Novosphingobium sp. SCN 63-17]OJX92659.1 MAG: hypothetical protein BGP00_22115 [Novosphingobium sp. 63-713]
MPKEKGPAIRWGLFCFDRIDRGRINARQLSMLVAGFQQLVQVDDDILHLGIVNAALGGAPPCFHGRSVIGKHADVIERVEVHEIEALRVTHTTADDEVEKLGHDGLFPANWRIEPLP